MLVFAVDQQTDRLQALRQAILKASPCAEVFDFRQYSEALSILRDERSAPDAVFADLSAKHPEDGLAFAKQLKVMCPSTRVILISDTEAYAVRAYSLHLEGYILRPFTEERIREELTLTHRDRIPGAETEKLQVRCFGNFAVFWRKKPLVFKRKKTPELLALLVDRCGAPCSAEEAISVLYENADPDAMGKAKQNLRNLIFDLTSTLEQIGQSKILIRTRSNIAVSPELLDCDYYRLLAGDSSADKEFTGEYMEQYSWAESAKGKLTFRESDPV